VGPARHPRARVILNPDSAAVARVRLEHASSAWPARQGVRPDYLRPPPPPRHPTRVTYRPPPLAPHLTRNPSAAAFDSAPSSSSRRRGAAPELRQEVSIAPVPLVVDPVHRVTLAASPEFLSRAATPSRRSAAWPPLSPLQLASCACTLHEDATRASIRAPEPWIGFAGEPAAARCRVADALRRPATCTCSRPPDRDPADEI
jgi:hypothetical protein